MSVLAQLINGIIKPLSGNADVPLIDKFGRLRTSENNRTQFDSLFTFGIDSLIWDTPLQASGGSVVYNSQRNSVTLSCTSTTGSKAGLCSRNRIRYQPGKSQLIKQTLNWLSSNGTFACVVRQNLTGTVVENRYTQDNFNRDKLNGSGNSGVTANLQKRQLLLFDFAYLGVGNVDFYFYDYLGRILNAHCFEFGNQAFGNDNGNNMYMAYPFLPFSVEIENDGTNIVKRVGLFDDNNGIFFEVKEPIANSSFDFFCCAIEAEAGQTLTEERGLQRSTSLSDTPRTVSTSALPILSIRPKATFSSKPNIGSIVPNYLEVFSDSTREFFVRLLLNPTLTGASWTSVSSSSLVEFDRSANSVSGGVVLAEFYLDGNISLRFSEEITAKIALGVAKYSGTRDVLTVEVRSLRSSGDGYAALGFKELY